MVHGVAIDSQDVDCMAPAEEYLIRCYLVPYPQHAIVYVHMIIALGVGRGFPP